MLRWSLVALALGLWASVCGAQGTARDSINARTAQIVRDSITCPTSSNTGPKCTRARQRLDSLRLALLCPRPLARASTPNTYFCPSVTPPPGSLTAPSTVAPGDLVAPGPTLTTLAPTFTWSAVTGATGYVAAVRNVAAGVIVYPSATGVGPPIAGTSVTLPSGILVAGTAYRWDVTAVNATTQSPPSANRFFVTAAAGPAPVDSIAVTFPGPIYAPRYASGLDYCSNSGPMANVPGRTTMCDTTTDTVTVCGVIVNADSSKVVGWRPVRLQMIGDSATAVERAGNSLASMCGSATAGLTNVTTPDSLVAPKITWRLVWLTVDGFRILRPVFTKSP